MDIKEAELRNKWEQEKLAYIGCNPGKLCVDCYQSNQWCECAWQSYRNIYLGGAPKASLVCKYCQTPLGGIHLWSCDIRNGVIRSWIVNEPI